ncbi:MAG: hypothetical protein QOE70_5164 [Chthoniobacter sp.]|nr:hypothetical protein [Chthoniobacter sp.]
MLMLDDGEIAGLLASFEWLAANPTAPADGHYRNRSGWLDFFKKSGSFAITYRREDREQRIYILKVDRLRR